MDPALGEIRAADIAADIAELGEIAAKRVGMGRPRHAGIAHIGLHHKAHIGQSREHCFGGIDEAGAQP
jgi:hypothetical protein